MRRVRHHLTAAERRELWERWRKGQTARGIAEALSVIPNTVYATVHSTGGFRPAERRRSARCLKLDEREEISRGISAGESIRHLAARLGRAPSSIGREIARNGGVEHYRAAQAEEAAWERARRPKRCLLASNEPLRAVVAAQLEEDLSPQQISGWLTVEYEDDPSMRISHETIYRSLFIQARGVLKKELLANLRTQRTTRRPKARGAKHSGTSIKDFVSISERPAEVEDRAVPGHWEGDLIQGLGSTFVATLVERHSRFVLLAKVSGKSTAEVVPVLVDQMRALPEQLRRSLTWDRGSELSGHRAFSMATDMTVYFCDPQSPWQRGSNENTNGLLRQYLKKHEYLSKYSQDDLDAFAAKLNKRPRKTLGYRTPAATLAAAVASTG
jgi:IS30 family transposase